MKDGILEAFGGSCYGQSGSSKSTPGWPVFVTAYLGLLLLVSLPILQTQFAPLIDYPNHLAADLYVGKPRFRRPIHLLSSPLGGFTQFGDGHCRHLPDELGIRAYRWQYLPVDDPVADFQRGVAFSFVLHQRIPWISLIAFYFLYNSVFLWGFVNFSFSIGVFLWVFAAWIRTDSSPSWLKIVGVRGAIAATFLLPPFRIRHLRCGHRRFRVREELQRALQGIARRWPAGHLPVAKFIPAALTFLFLSPTSGAAGTAVTYGSLEIRVAALVTFIRNYIVALDLVTLIILGVLIAVGLMTRKLQVHKSLVGVLGLLVVVSLIMPFEFFAGSGATNRPPLALAFLVVCSLRCVKCNATVVRWITAGLLVLFVIRMMVVSNVWRQSSDVYANYMEAFEPCPMAICWR